MKDSTVERVMRAIEALVDDMDGCYSNRCTCSGSSAFECKSGVKIEDIALVAIEAIESADAQECADIARSLFQTEPRV